MKPNSARAKRIITEILRHCPEGIGKTKLYKIFWLAHLFYAKDQPGLLSDWPVVRMPNGPGIDRANVLLKELVKEERVKISHVQVGPFVETCHKIGKPDIDELPEPAIASIKMAVDFIRPLSAEQCSELSHEFSRSWNTAKDGEELDIYSDLIPEDVFEQRGRELRKLATAIEESVE